MRSQRRTSEEHGANRVIIASAAAAPRIERGHPWMYREAVKSGGGGLGAGEVVEVRGPGGEPIGQGLWDPRSPIAVRLYCREPSPRLDADGLARLVERAFVLRDGWFAIGDTTAYRLCNGEGDGVPGLVLDRYGPVAVLKADGDAISAWIPRIGERIWPSLRDRGIKSLVERFASAGAGEPRTRALFGETPPESVQVLENGVAMVVDIARGQKTGAFLDQRDNRARVRVLAAGRRVLNLFSYAGGFSTAAALGGAAHVTSVDIAQAAHATAQQSMRVNGIDPSSHAFVTADVQLFLEGAGRKAQSWDLIVSDPPSFAPSEKARQRALGAYRRLHGACARVLSPKGVLCAASCSSHVTADDFVQTLDSAAVGATDMRLTGLFGQPCDHPTLPAWPEGRYLKFAVLVRA
jgi:23S rRNA (cytosine1962-C5)-methyltransferase